MPLGVRHEGDLGQGLLDPVLAENGQAGRDGSPEAVRPDGLRDSDELDVPRLPPRALGGRGNALEDTFASGPERRDLGGSGPRYFCRRRNEGISRSSVS